MDLLIDLIIYFIKQVTKDKPPRITPPGFREIERQKAATEQRIAEMRAAVANQQARTKPVVAKRGPARGAAVPAAVSAARSISQTPDIWTTPASGVKVPSIVSSSRGRAPIRGLRIPIILGEVLAPPLALREQEM